MPIVTKQKIAGTPKQKNKLLVEHPQMDAIIKSVRVFEKAEKIHLDYRVNPEYKRDSKERSRFSTGEQSTRRGLQRIERDKYAIALANYLDNTTLLDGANLTLGDIALDALEENKNDREDDIQVDYINIYTGFIKPVFADRIIGEIKVSDLKRWKDNLLKKVSMSKSRYAKYHRTLSFIFQYAYLNEYIDKNPISLLDRKSKLFKVSRKNASKQYYTSTEAKILMDEASDWFKVFLSVLFFTGIRTGEALSLRHTDINFDKSQLTIQRSIRKGKMKQTTKTGVDRIIDVPQPLLEMLQTYILESMSPEWLFVNPKTMRPYTESSSIIKWKFKPLLKSLGIEYKSLYSTRHSFATIASENGLPMTYIQRQLGHAKVSTTMDYYIKNGLLSEMERDRRIDKLYA